MIKPFRKYSEMTDSGKNRHEDELAGRFSQDIYSKVVRAGKRTYFFDVKSTRNDEMFLIITESIKRTEADGDISYEKHKIFIYREDFENFADSLKEVYTYISAHQKEIPSPPVIRERGTPAE